MNDAIQKQLEGRLNEIGLFPDDDIPNIARRLAEENAALRQMCADALKALEWSIHNEQIGNLRDHLADAAKGRPVK